MSEPGRPSSTGEPGRTPPPYPGYGLERQQPGPSTRRRWTPIRVVLLVMGAVATAIVMGLYSFLTVWLALSGSG